MSHAVAKALLFLVVLAHSGCRQPDYFPLACDSHWDLLFRTYEIAGAETVELRCAPGLARVVTERNDQKLGQFFVVEIIRGPTRLYTLFLQRRRSGTYLLLPWLAVEFGSADAEWILVLESRPRPGQVWFGNARREQLFEVVGREAVLVPAGQFPGCLKVAVHSAEEAWPDFIWFAPDRGPVRWEHRRTRLCEGRTRERIERVELAPPNTGLVRY